MGTPTGRRNKSTGERRQHQQTALQQPPPVVTTKLTIINEGARWSWAMEHYGVSYTSGVPPASGPAVFNELNTAADSAMQNYQSARNMAMAQRSRERAARAMEAEPSPGE